MLYRIGNVEVAAGSPAMADALKNAHDEKLRPLCMCKHPGVEMYVSRFADKYVVKRMPGSAENHDSDCENHQPSPLVSGLGEVVGSAIQEDIATGSTLLKLDFSLTKVAGRSAPGAATSTADSVKTDGAKLTLRGLLHYLWNEANLTRWVPGMEGKRNWFVVRRALLQAAANKSTKGADLLDTVYVPETFDLTRKDVIVARRAERLAKVMGGPPSTRKLLVLIGEIKDFAPGRFNMKAIVRHLPDMHLQIPDDLMTRLKKRFSAELEMWEADKSTHLMTAATFSVSQVGITTIEEMSLMVVTENWLPIENAFEQQLLEVLHKDRRRFSKCLRYNMAETRPLASVVLADTRPEPAAMYVLADLSDQILESLAGLLLESKLTPWVWRPTMEGVPPVPPAGHYEADRQQVVDQMLQLASTDEEAEEVA